jgi:ABC-type branched-subunit amino acid transport system substrate-binding protein
MKLTHSLLTLSLAGTLAFSGRVALAADGITDSEIKLGMCNALTGNSAALGTGMKAGASAFFAKLNAAGGVNGRQLTLVSYDDGYEPQRTIAQTTKLIDEDKVFALFGYVGTPTSAAILPQLAKSGIPFLAPYTGAEMLRNPVRKNIFNVRASYFDETEGLVERLTTDLGAKSIGVFVQDDAYGAAGEAGVVKALRKRGLTLAGKGVYTRNTVEVAAGLAALTQAKPDAVIMIGSYKACAAFVKQAKAGGFKPVFCNVSFVGTAALIGELGADGEGIYISQVMPSPWDASVPVVKDYQEALKAAGQTEYDYSSLEGYVSAAIFARALDQAGKDLTRDSFTAALESLNADIGSLPAAFSPTSHQALKTIYFTKVQGGKAVPITKF